MTREEQLVAYADYCGIPVEELLSYLDDPATRGLVGLTARDMTPSEQIEIMTGRVCTRCKRLQGARWFPLEGSGLHAHCVKCCTC